MARDYNEQAPDGSWRHVTQDDSGKYTVMPISPSGQAAAGIPGGGGAAGSATSTADQLAGLDSAAGGHWNGDRSDPGAVAAAYAAAGSGGGGDGSFTGWNSAAAGLAEQVAQNKATMAYNYATLDFQKMQYNTLSAYQKDQMALQRAQDAWSQSYQESQQKWTETYQQAQLTYQDKQFDHLSAADKQNAAIQRTTQAFNQYAHDTQSADQAAQTKIQQGTLDYTKYAHDTQSADQAANSAQAQADLAYQREHDQALIDFQNVQFNNMSADQKEQAAIQRAQQAGTEKYQQAQIDLQQGTQSGYTSTGNATLDRQKMEQDAAIQQSGLSGYTTTGNATLDRQRLEQDTAIRQNTLSGYTDTGAATLDRQKTEQEGALGLLNVAKDLRGPADMFAYQNAMGNAPQGLRSVLDAVAGKYQMGVGAAQGTTPMAGNVGYLVDDIQHGGLAPSVRPGGANAEFAPAGAAQQATLQAQAYGLPNYQQPGTTTGQGIATSDMGMAEFQRQQAQPGATSGYTYPAYQPPTTQTNPALAQQTNKNTIPNELAKPVGTSTAGAGFTAPGQWSPTAMNQLAPAQKDALMAYNENKFGWRPEEQQWAYAQSLPKYGGPKTGSTRTF